MLTLARARTLRFNAQIDRSAMARKRESAFSRFNYTPLKWKCEKLLCANSGKVADLRKREILVPGIFLCAIYLVANSVIRLVSFGVVIVIALRAHTHTVVHCVSNRLIHICINWAACCRISLWFESMPCETLCIMFGALHTHTRTHSKFDFYLANEFCALLGCGWLLTII